MHVYCRPGQWAHWRVAMAVAACWAASRLVAGRLVILVHVTADCRGSSLLLADLLLAEFVNTIPKPSRPVQVLLCALYCLSFM
jgi:hypothetical protein